MNLKIANLVAIQLGIFIGMMSWLAYSRFPSAEPRTVAEMQKSAVAPTAPVAVASKKPGALSSAPEDNADLQQPQPVVEQQAALSRRYEQQIAPQRYVSSGFDSESVATDSSSSAEPAQEPSVVSSDYLESPQTISYAQPAQVIVYSQPQFIAFFNQRRLANRRRVTPHPGALTATPHRGPDRGDLHPNGDGVMPRPDNNAPPCRPTHGPRPRGQSQIVGRGR